jgi:hypothetical protein
MTREQRHVLEQPHGDRREPEPAQAKPHLHATMRRAVRRGRVRPADLETLRDIKAGRPPPSEDRAWNRLARLGLAHVEVSTSGGGDVELRFWKLTPRGEACADLDT